MSLNINTNLMANNTARNLSNHYGELAKSVQRLSSGLRVNSSADDAAGLAIREMMRADIAALNQGVRNVNDAISMIQTADGALGIIDEKLIRMKELAEQGATGTYSSDQRLMIDSEFQAMAAEIERIANATNFNGIPLLNGNLCGIHVGSGLQSTGAAKIHFGPTNDSSSDYYYINIPALTLAGLGFEAGTPTAAGGPSSILSFAKAGSTSFSKTAIPSGMVAMSYIPAGTKNITITIDGYGGAEDDIQLFTRSGVHLSGTQILPGADNDITWTNRGVTPDNVNDTIITTKNGFHADASYTIPAGGFNDGGTDTWDLRGGLKTNYNGMAIFYSGDYDQRETGTDWNNGSIDNRPPSFEQTKEQVHIDEATEDILIFITGMGVFGIDARWDSPEAPAVLDISTQEKAQEMLESIDRAIGIKDTIRAHLGAMQNRLENTASNLMIQAENLQASESRISDVDVAQEMTSFVRGQILTQSATAMLSQANSLPQMALQVIQA